MIKLTPQVLHGFMQGILQDGLDSPKPTPKFHLDMWEKTCDENEWVAIAAPRGHAKSSAGTIGYGLANIAFGLKDYVVIMANTTNQASKFLKSFRNYIVENEKLHKLFGISPRLTVDNETVLEGKFTDGRPFRVEALGSGQQIRGLLWNNKRPNLFLGDDLEDAEMVRLRERREKFSDYFYADIVPAMSETGIIRVFGTILHEDSLLENLLQDPDWTTARYRAHDPDDIEKDILWPEKFPVEKLKKLRRTAIRRGKGERYAQEFLNIPIDTSNGFFRKEDFSPMVEGDEGRNMLFYIFVDPAVSTRSASDPTAVLVLGVDENGTPYVRYVINERMDTLELANLLFALNKKCDPQAIIFESGVIEKSLGPFLNQEMLRRQQFFTIDTMTPSGDKEFRAQSVQAMMRANFIKFDKEAPWYEDYEHQLLQFPRGMNDDMVDVTAYAGLYLEELGQAATSEELDHFEYEREVSLMMAAGGDGRDVDTGY